MGKREIEKKPRNARDFYATIDPAAAKAILPYIDRYDYAEPCWGKGNLEQLLINEGMNRCLWRGDIEQSTEGYTKGCNIKDATEITEEDLQHCSLVVTNPPFSWTILKPLLDYLPTLKPTWMLLPADVMHNVRMGPYMKICPQIVSVGRLYWMENKIKGVDNFCWFQFTNDPAIDTRFRGR